jgi:hypothetical protein
MKMKVTRANGEEVHVSFERIWKENIWSLLFFEEKQKSLDLLKKLKIVLRHFPIGFGLLTIF